jgi:ABC-type transporter Mla MlaB component
MLRITTHDNPRPLTFRLEGQLSGPWVRELEECWRRALAGASGPVVTIDLTDVTAIDAAGQACLAGMHRQGAEFVAADCLMKAVVAEITGGRFPDRGAPEVTGVSAQATVSRPRPADLERGAS